MLKEFVEQLAKQAVDAAMPRIIVSDRQPKDVFALAVPGQTPEWKVAQPAARDHKAACVATVVAKTLTGTKPVIWYSRTGVIGLLDDNSRRDRVTFALSPSPQMKELALLETHKDNLKQRDLIFMIRTTFKDCLGPAGNLLEVLRKITFTLGDSGTAVEKHGKRSVGRQIEEEMTGAAALPEYVRLDVPVFSEAAVYRHTHRVELALEPDAATASFKFFPLPGQTEMAFGKAEDWLAEIIAEELDGGPAECLLGTP